MDPATDCVLPHSNSSTLLGIVILVGIIVSWAPQSAKIIRTKSTRGISAAYIFFTQLANWLPLISAVLLHWADVQCCWNNEDWDCGSSLLTIYQLTASAVSVFLIHLLFVVYYEPNYSTNSVELRFAIEMRSVGYFGEEEAMYADMEPAPVMTASPRERQCSKSTQKTYFVLACVLLAAIALAGVYLIAALGSDSMVLQMYAGVIGVLGTLVVVIQFLPQIWLTFKTKDIGSLSLLMLLIQTPGTVVWLVYMMTEGEIWPVWLSTFAAVVQLSVLLWQAFVFGSISDYRARWSCWCPSVFSLCVRLCDPDEPGVKMTTQDTALALQPEEGCSLQDIILERAQKSE